MFVMYFYAGKGPLWRDRLFVLIFDGPAGGVVTVCCSRGYKSSAKKICVGTPVVIVFHCKPNVPTRPLTPEGDRKGLETQVKRMVIVAKMNILAVGVGSRGKSLEGLPVRLVNLKDGYEAVSSFKTEQVDSVISHWHLADMPNGKFLKKLKAVKPQMPTIAIIEGQNPQQEIEARCLGVAAVITEDSSEEHFRRVITSVLGLQDAEAITELYAVKEM
jgi:CheY-like chemotaxis protein